MIDLTPLEVRKKKGDFRRGLRGYDPPHVDDFLDIVADRLETVVRENLDLRERVARFEQQVADYREREKALTEALVTAQEMREEMRAQTAREADASRRQAEHDAGRIRGEAQEMREREEEVLRRLRGRQLEFLQTYRAFLERELAELAAMMRGLEMNGTMGDVLATPSPNEPRAMRPLAPPRPAPAAAAPESSRASESVEAVPDAPARSSPGADDWAMPADAPPGRTAAKQATPVTLPPKLERTTFAAGIAGAGAPGRIARPTAGGPVGEAELILSDDDVLPDDDVVPDDGDVAGAASPDHPVSDRAAGTEAVPPMDNEQPRVDPPRRENSSPAEENLGLDLVPEDFAELGEIGRQEAPELPDAKSMRDRGARPTNAAKSESQRKDDEDDTDDLLRSLFGDHH